MSVKAEKNHWNFKTEEYSVFENILSVQKVKINVHFERISNVSREVDKEVNRAFLSQEKENSEEQKCP